LNPGHFLQRFGLYKIFSGFQGISVKKAMTLMMEAVSTSETSVNIYETTQSNIQKTAIFNDA
jgi:hypothetical protein